jgi:hypothetical protein
LTRIIANQRRTKYRLDETENRPNPFRIILRIITKRKAIILL